MNFFDTKRARQANNIYGSHELWCWVQVYKNLKRELENILGVKS